MANWSWLAPINPWPIYRHDRNIVFKLARRYRPLFRGGREEEFGNRNKLIFDAPKANRGRPSSLPFSRGRREEGGNELIKERRRSVRVVCSLPPPGELHYDRMEKTLSSLLISLVPIPVFFLFQIRFIAINRDRTINFFLPVIHVPTFITAEM